jgi:hypothetical protein
VVVEQGEVGNQAVQDVEIQGRLILVVEVVE